MENNNDNKRTQKDVDITKAKFENYYLRKRPDSHCEKFQIQKTYNSFQAKFDKDIKSLLKFPDKTINLYRLTKEEQVKLLYRPL